MRGTPVFKEPRYFSAGDYETKAASKAGAGGSRPAVVGAALRPHTSVTNRVEVQLENFCWQVLSTCHVMKASELAKESSPHEEEKF